MTLRPSARKAPRIYRRGMNWPSFLGAWAPGYLSPIPLSDLQQINYNHSVAHIEVEWQAASYLCYVWQRRSSLLTDRLPIALCASTVPGGTREQVILLARIAKRFRTPNLYCCTSNGQWQVRWMKEEPPSFMAGSVR